MVNLCCHCSRDKKRFVKDMIFSEYLVDNKAMVRTEKYKYIFTNGKADLGLGYTTGHPPAGIRHELYDMKNDPNETTNLADKQSHKKIVESLRERLLEEFRRTHPLTKSIPRDIAIDKQLALFCEPIESGTKAQK